MKPVIQTLIAVLGGILSLGCATQPYVSTISNGSHIAWTDEQWKEWEHGDKKVKRFVVWGDHPGVTSTVMSALQQNGQSVVERARLQEVFNEQKIVLTHTAEDYADVFRVGKLLGADVVVFAETAMRHELIQVASRNTLQQVFHVMQAVGTSARDPVAAQRLQLEREKQDAQNRQVAYHLSVAVRAVKIETGEILWNGASRINQPITEPETALILLTNAAMHRAVCPLERGAKWTEFRSDKPEDPWGCSK
ncbi:MAG: hypothetical protein CV089_20600 [Nitrospira sp. WS110]|nr:hypothetical protein [Nitrospira sp. WS110]